MHRMAPRLLPRLLLWALACLPPLAAAQTELDRIVVEQAEEPDATSESTEDLGQGAANATLGAYLDDMPNVDSASYGEAVGRPVVRGMSGYRIKILQNDHDVSDLSAMSQDHAVAVAPQASERIELLKGPASLLYAAQAGGVVRISDALDSLFRHSGLHSSVSGDLRAGPASQGLHSHLHYANERWAAHLGGLQRESDPYESGDGAVIQDSDLSTQQAQLGLGYRPGAASEWQLSTTWLAKDYGIPNSTPEETRIDMERRDVSGAFRYQPDWLWLDGLRVDLHYSDYLHDETESGRRDGLFGQEQLSSALNLDWLSGVWSGQTRLSLSQGELRVCHQHGACDRFRTAVRTGGPLGESVLQSVEERGLPYSHGHPMPDTQDDTLQLSTVARRPLSPTHTMSLGVHGQWRQLTPDPDNIQEQWVQPAALDPDHYRRQDDQALSLSLGLGRQVPGRAFSWNTSLSYLERFPSVDELYWNGFHHATDTYIFGDVDLAKEASLNLDLDLVFRRDAHRAQLSGFYYRFRDYIYQDQAFDESGTPLIDPFHLSDVWFTRQSDAQFFGASLRYEHQLQGRTRLPLTLWAQADALSAQRANGDNLPRSAPANAALGVVYDSPLWQASLTLKRVFVARNLAPNESATDGYSWLSAYLQRGWVLDDQNVELWLKGENLLDAPARNHLSVLKDNAPLPGRQIIAGARWRF